MTIAKRVFLFILTNILVIVSLNILIAGVSAFFGVRLSPDTYQGLIVFCSIFGMGGALISLMISKWMAKTMMGVQVIDPNKASGIEYTLVETVHRLAQRAGLPKMPEVGIYESPEVNAFATGPSKSSSLVAVSTGLLQTMSDDEVEGVLGHEISHIANGDMVTMTLIQGIVNTFSMVLSRILASILASQVEERNRWTIRWVATMILDVIFSVFGMILVAYFSRRREFRADRGSSQVTSSGKMIAALRKLQRLQEQPVAFVTDSSNGDQSNKAASGFEVLKISSNPRRGFLALFRTHPPLEDRIHALQMHQV